MSFLTQEQLEEFIDSRVTSAYRQNAAASTAGAIFADEEIFNFYTIMKTLASNTFEQLEVSFRGKSRHERQEALRKVADWHADVATEETRIAKTAYENLALFFQRALLKYARHAFRGTGMRFRLQIPTVDAFLQAFYAVVARSAQMGSGSYFTSTYLDKDLFMRDAFRSALHACLRVNVINETGGALDDLRSHVDMDMRGGGGGGGGFGGFGSSASEIHPLDSVSHVHGTPAVEPSAVPDALAAADAAERASVVSHGTHLSRIARSVAPPVTRNDDIKRVVITKSSSLPAPEDSGSEIFITDPSTLSPDRLEEMLRSGKRGDSMSDVA